MIVEWLVNLAAGLFKFIADLFPDWETPPELLDPTGLMAQVMAHTAGLGIFVDWALIGALALIPLGVWVLGLSFRALKTLISHIPFFGGN